MNSDIQSMNTSKYEKLGKASNTQINRRNNSNNFQKQKSDSSSTSTSHTSPSSTKQMNATAGKHQVRKLVDSKQVSGPFHQNDKKAFLLDTYARIVASNNRRCPKRLRELAKPKRQARSDQHDYTANFDLNYGHVTKTYRTDDKRNLKESKKK
ncbi:PREDICTED: uncharacterized protein LOC105457527 [Wasmannia auropunctata]|uniref:uncharacterized protein LOC105457527 n=1 Tax=Wasmannia auropunctata TaxID=64793 RepID=UPI0005EDE990|nr:PREDICTED: uncharacterized protein LOC105457527 [Wasmannia auropunctata]